MKPESQIDQKKLLELIKRINKEHKAKIKTKGSITELAESFAEGIELLSEAGAALPEEAIDFFNDLFADESAGYKGVEVTKDTEPEPDPVEDAEPLPEAEPADEVEDLPELEPEAELPGEEEEPPRRRAEPEPDEEEELEELEELDEEPPPERSTPVNRKPIAKQTPKAAPPKKEETMIEKLDAITKKPELKAFVKEHNINVKLKNTESVQVWKAKIKKSMCPAPAPKAEKAAPKAAAKPAAKPKAETKAVKKAEPKAKAEKPAKKAKSDKPKLSRSEKDAFGITVGSLTHKFIQAVVKKPQTMKMISDAGLGKHPKTVKKLIAMGYMERDKSGLLSLTIKGRKVYQGGK